MSFIHKWNEPSCLYSQTALLLVLIYCPAEGRRLGSPGCLVTIIAVCRPKTVTHPSTNRARRRVTLLTRPTPPKCPTWRLRLNYRGVSRRRRRFPINALVCTWSRCEYMTRGDASVEHLQFISWGGQLYQDNERPCSHWSLVSSLC